MRSWAFVLSGFAAGTFSGMLGVGGALLATPLIRFLGVPPYLAIGTTVPVLLPTTLTGAWTYLRSGFVDRKVVGWTALAGAGAAVLGAGTTRLVDGHLLMLATAGVMILLALRVLPGRGETGPPPDPRRSPALLSGIGTTAGFLSGLLGIGGGFVMVPAFLRLVRLPLKTTLGTSLAVITLTALPNIAAQSYVGNVDWKVALLLALGVVPGARIGALAAIRMPDKVLRPVVALVILGVGVLYAATEARALFS